MHIHIKFLVHNNIHVNIYDIYNIKVHLSAYKVSQCVLVPIAEIKVQFPLRCPCSPPPLSIMLLLSMSRFQGLTCDSMEQSKGIF